MLTSPIILEQSRSGGIETSSSSLGQLGEDYQSFLTLLTAQIQNQDPLSPVDSTDFVAQLAQLSQVEQSVKSNNLLENLGYQIAGLLNISGTDLIGREVKTTTNVAELRDGAIKSSYAVEDGAVEVEARITDPVGRVVRTLRGLSTEAFKEIPLEWNGRDENGEPQLEGVYEIELIATDANGNAVATELSRMAEVKEVIFQNGEILFKLSGDETVSSVTVLSAR